MSIQNKFDLTLFGNIVIDNIYCIPKWANEGTSNTFISNRISIGGLGNIIEALLESKLSIYINSIINNESSIVYEYLKKYSIEYNFQLSNKETSQSVILSSLETKERTSFVNWGCGHDLNIISDIKNKWSHISYLDICTKLDLKNIRQNSDIVSADLCLSNPSEEIIKITLKNLQYLDYLFISETEIFPLINSYNITNIKNFVKNNNLKCLILHTKNKTIIIENNNYEEVDSNQITIYNIDVLGAGDFYCANFIYYQLTNIPNNIKAAEYAHKQATAFILKRKNEKI